MSTRWLVSAALAAAALTFAAPSVHAAPRYQCHIVKLSGQHETVAGRCPCLGGADQKRCARDHGIAHEEQVGTQTHDSGGASYGAHQGYCKTCKP